MCAMPVTQDWWGSATVSRATSVAANAQQFLAAHPGPTFKYTKSRLLDLRRWDATDQIELLEQPLLMRAGSKADRLYMTEQAFAKATGMKNKAFCSRSTAPRTSRPTGCPGMSTRCWAS